MRKAIFKKDVKLSGDAKAERLRHRLVINYNYAFCRVRLGGRSVELFYDPNMLIEKRNEDFIIYSPLNHRRIVGDEYIYFVIEYIMQKAGMFEPALLTQEFNRCYNTDLAVTEMLEQINKLLLTQIIFISPEEMTRAKAAFLHTQEFSAVPQLQQVYIHPTLRCNFACEYCYLQEKPQSAEGELTTRQWIEIIEQLKEVGVREIVITGGEPLLRNDIEEIVRSTKNAQTRFYLLTNGSLLPDRFLGILNLFDHITISLDSFDPIVNAQNRSEYGFREILRTLELFANTRPDKLTVNTVITRYNVEEFNVFQDMLKARYGIKTTYSYFTPTRLEEIELVPPFGSIEGAELRGNHDIFKNHEPHELNSSLRKCPAAITTLAINPYGSIFPCQVLVNENTMKITSVWKDNWLEEVMQSEIRRQFFELTINTIETCQDCGHRYICTGGCAAISYMLYGELHCHLPFLCEHLKKAAAENLIWGKGVWKNL